MAAKKKPVGKAVKKSGAKSVKKTKAKPPAKAAKAPKKKSAGSKSAGKAATVYKLKVGDSAPDFSAPATSGQTLSKSGFKGKKVVLYFYPKDNTPGCTLEGQDFRRLKKEFAKSGCEIVGVSQDSLKSHENFKAKCDFNFALLSDENGELCRAFDVMQMKNLYGREYLGIERSTFVIDGLGKICAEWRKVRVEGHAGEVLDFVKKM